jgi:hypothetical protein
MCLCSRERIFIVEIPFAWLDPLFFIRIISKEQTQAQLNTIINGGGKIFYFFASVFQLRPFRADARPTSMTSHDVKLAIFLPHTCAYNFQLISSYETRVSPQIIHTWEAKMCKFIERPLALSLADWNECVVRTWRRQIYGKHVRGNLSMQRDYVGL